MFIWGLPCLDENNNEILIQFYMISSFELFFDLVAVPLCSAARYSLGPEPARLSKAGAVEQSSPLLHSASPRNNVVKKLRYTR